MLTRLAILPLVFATLLACSEKAASTVDPLLPFKGQGQILAVTPFLPWGTIQTPDGPRRYWYDQNTVFMVGQQILKNYPLQQGQNIAYKALQQQGELYLINVQVLP